MIGFSERYILEKNIRFNLGSKYSCLYYFERYHWRYSIRRKSNFKIFYFKISFSTEIAYKRQGFDSNFWATKRISNWELEKLGDLISICRM